MTGSADQEILGTWETRAERPVSIEFSEGGSVKVDGLDLSFSGRYSVVNQRIEFSGEGVARQNTLGNQLEMIFLGDPPLLVLDGDRLVLKSESVSVEFFRD